MPPVKNPCVMTSYGGITRIRSRVEVRLLPLSLHNKLPCICLLSVLYTGNPFPAIGDQHKKQTPFLANIPNFRFRETETAPCAGQWMRTTQNTDKFVDPRPTAGDFYILGTFDQRSIIGWMESRSKAVCLWEKPCWSRHHT